MRAKVPEQEQNKRKDQNKSKDKKKTNGISKLIDQIN